MKGSGKLFGKRMLSGILTVLLLISSVDLTVFAADMKRQGDVYPQEQQSENESSTADGTDLPGEGNAVSVGQSGLNLEAANGLGSVLLNDFSLAAQEGQEEAQAGYGISRIDMVGFTANVVLHVSGSCVAVIGIYEEGSTRPYAFGSAPVSVEKSFVNVEIETEEMPEFFEIRGYLIDENSLRPLSTEYQSIMYTRTMQEFLKKTTADFDENKVLNLDEDNSTNFAVVSDQNVLVREHPGAGEDAEAVNVLKDYDETRRTYTFINGDESFDAVQKGSTLVYSQGDGNILIIKVESIVLPESTDQEGTIVITAAGNMPETDDVFSYIKIEEETTLADAVEPDAGSCPKGVTYLGSDTAVGYALTNESNPIGFSAETKWELNLGEFEGESAGSIVSGKIGGNITLALKMEVSLVYYLDVFKGVGYVDVNVPVAVGIEGTLECEGELACPLVTAPLEINSKVLTVRYIPKFVVHAGIKATFSKLELEGELGFKAGFGLEDGSQGAYSNLEFRVGELEVEAEGYIGVDFNPELAVGDLASAELGAAVHLGIKAAYQYSGTATVITTQNEKHSCKQCVDGSMYLKIPLEAKYKLGVWKGEISKEISLWEKPFYYSIDNRRFGWGACSSRNFKIAVKTVDGGSDLTPIAGAKVSVEGIKATSDNTGTTNAKGEATLWLPGGSSRILCAYKDGEKIGSKGVNVDGSKSVIITSGQYAVDDGIKEVYVGVGEPGGDDSDSIATIAALRKDGSLYLWGDNTYGQIGNGNTEAIQKEPFKALSDVKEFHWFSGCCKCAAAITKTGKLYLWGDNSNGLLDSGESGDNTKLRKPHEVSGLSGVKKFWESPTKDGCAVLTVDGDLYLWGNNEYGQMGNGQTLSRPLQQAEPCKVEGLPSVKEFFWAPSGRSCAAVTTDGGLYLWGDNEYGQIANGQSGGIQKEPYKVEVPSVREFFWRSYNTSCAVITEEGVLYTWGYNCDGLTGNGSDSYLQTEPVEVLNNVKDLCFNSQLPATAAVTVDGKLYTWGRNEGGALGNGKEGGVQTQPVEVSTFNNTSVKKFYWEETGRNAAAIMADGSLYLWGDNTFGQLGNGEGGADAGSWPEPQKVSGLGRVKEFVWIGGNTGAAAVTAAAVTEDDALYMWGGNSQGQIDNATEAIQKIPVKVLENVREIQFYYDSYLAGVGSAKWTCVIVAACKDGSLWGWGNAQGLDAEPKKLFSSASAKTFCLSGTWKRHNPNAGSYRGTVHFNVAGLTKDGSLYMWGDNTSGQLGSDAAGTGSFETDGLVYFYNEPSASVLSGRIASVDGDAAGSSDKAVKFTDLKANEIYNIYAMKSRDNEEPLAPENLLFVGQALSDENGMLEAVCELREAYDTPEIFVVGWTQMNLSSAEIAVDDIVYDATEHLVDVTVTFDGKTLTEGRDYEIYGSCAVTDIGEYKITVKGIGLYCGEKETVFQVKEGSENPDPNPDPGPNPDPNPDPGPEPELGDVLPEDVPADGVIPQGLWIAGIVEAGYAYTGRAIQPEVRVYDHKTLLKLKTDYVISYKNNTKVNDTSDTAKAPTITVTGKGNYSGKETVNFRILALDIGEDSFDADDMSISCNGKAQTPVPVLFWKGKKLKYKKDFLITYYDSAGKNSLNSVKDEGDYIVEITGIGAFSKSRRINLGITDKLKQIGKVSVSKIPVQPYHSYSQSAVASALTVKDGKETLREGVHYTVRFSNDTGVGTAYAVITGKKEGGYSGTKRVSFKIAGISIRKASVTGLVNTSYTGDNITPDLQLTVRDGGTPKTLEEGRDYAVTWQNNCNAGTASVILTGLGEYTGTLKKTFKIKAFHITENAGGRFGAVVEKREVPYAKGGGRPVLKVTFTRADGTVQSLREGTDYTLKYRNNKSVSAAGNSDKLPVVEIKGKGNYTGVFQGQELTYQIVPQDIGNLILTCADKTYQNKKNIYATKVTITDLDGKALKAGMDYEKTLTYTYKNDTALDNGVLRAAGVVVDKEDIIPAGTIISVSAVGKGNYTGTIKGEYRITQAQISGAKVTIQAQEYTGKAITLDENQIAVQVKGQELDRSQYRIVPGSYRNNVKKGTASVTIQGLDNYGGTKTVKFAIKAKGFTWWWRKEQK